MRRVSRERLPELPETQLCIQVIFAVTDPCSAGRQSMTANSVHRRARFFRLLPVITDLLLLLSD